MGISIVLRLKFSTQEKTIQNGWLCEESLSNFGVKRDNGRPVYLISSKIDAIPGFVWETAVRGMLCSHSNSATAFENSH